MTALIIPSLGSPTLASCLEAVTALTPGPDHIVVVLSGTSGEGPDIPGVEVLHSPKRLGFAEAVNRGITATINDHAYVGLLNDDAMPSPGWLNHLLDSLERNDRFGAVQGTVSDYDTHINQETRSDQETRIDGRGIEFDRFGLPVQIDRGRRLEEEGHESQAIPAASATACVYRSEALRSVALSPIEFFDSSYGSYHEDLDLGLRLLRNGWLAAWVPQSGCRHLGSASGFSLRWRHPWWLLANRWRALAGNLKPVATVRLVPRLLRGELRATRTLLRINRRVALVAPLVFMLLPFLLLSGWLRTSPGKRLNSIPEFAR